MCAAGMEKPGRLAGGNVPVDGTGWMTLSVNESDERRLRRAFERMMRRLHEAETGAELRVEFLAEDEPQAFIREHQGILTGALEEVEMSEGMRSRLNSSHYVFSGMKTFHELKEAFPELTRADGSRKSFREFLDDVRKVDETYNKSWLRAEYNFAHRSAQMAARWEASEKNGDRYLLQYRTQSDSKVRPEHAALHGVTLEKGDGFWDYYLPPNGWGCRCTVVEVLRDQYAKTPHDEAMELGEEATQNDRRNMFRWNSGKKGRTFPDYNPYTIRRCRDCDMNSGKGKLAFVPENELCEACRLVHSGLAKVGETRKEGNGTVTISKLVDRKDSDFRKLDEIATFFAREYGAEVILTPKMSRPHKFQYECVYSSLIGTKYEGKCPDLCINGIWYEHEGFTSANPKNAFRNMLNDGLKQSDRIVIDKPQLTERYIIHSIERRIRDGQNKKEIWTREPGGNIRLLYKKTDG